MEKKEVRKRMRMLKKQYTLEERKEKSVPVWEEIERNEHFRNAKVVLAYWSMDDEVFTHDYVCRWAGSKTMLLPCVRGEELDIRYFDGTASMKPGEGYAIPEPTGELFTDLDGIDLILVPGVAFDRKNRRLGRGKGYYDRILKKSPAYKLGVCFDFQLLEEVPVEEHDVPMDAVAAGIKA